MKMSAHGKENLESENSSIDSLPESETLEQLLEKLKSQMKTSDWLTLNTSEKFAKENPDVAKAFHALKTGGNQPAEK